MAIYAIGDIQGCYQQLRQLLRKIRFKSDRDKLWFAGDLVNRGPESLETLRFIKDLQDNAVTVLGNHDLTLLAIANGQKKLKNHTLDAILNAPDRDQLLHWLRRQKLMHYDKERNYVLVHAGIYPLWDLKTALKRSREVENILAADTYADFFPHMFGNTPNVWDKKLQGWERIRFITNCFTRMRYCTEAGELNFKDNQTPGTQQAGYLPWYEVKQRQTQKEHIIFGHWSTLFGKTTVARTYALDTGCLWGGKLTAMKLLKQAPKTDNKHQRIQIDCTKTKK